ncbi:MAG: response regulator [Balneolaceae bacterium]|nr:response regulator [Balneolaceae bacterium]
MPELAHTYSSVIADDEEPARRRIRELLVKEPDIHLLEICKNGKEAIHAIRNHQPDILFLDIQMPEIDGFDVISELKNEHIPITIFVTAYDRYAIRAFEVYAVDYLLKPFSDERFAGALERAKKQAELESREPFLHRLESLLNMQAGQPKERSFDYKSDYIDRIVLEKNGEKFFLYTRQITWIEAEGAYVFIHAGDKKIYQENASGNTGKKARPPFFYSHSPLRDRPYRRHRITSSPLARRL